MMILEGKRSTIVQNLNCNFSMMKQTSYCCYNYYFEKQMDINQMNYYYLIPFQR